MFDIYCIGAGVFGLLMGYLFAYSSRNTVPSGGEVAGLLGTVLGGTALQFLATLGCQYSLPVYVIGVAVGYLVYIFLLARNTGTLGAIATVTPPGTQRTPFFFWHQLRNCPAWNRTRTAQHQNPPTPDAGVTNVTYDARGRVSTITYTDGSIASFVYPQDQVGPGAN